MDETDVGPFAVARSLRLRNVSRLLGRGEVAALFKPDGEECRDYSLKPFIRTNSLFVHVPRTGGASICRALYGSLGMGHLTIADYRSLFRRRAFARMFKFAFVRNPFDQIHSAYHFLRSGGMDELDIDFNQRVLSRFPSFEKFILDGLEREEVTGFWHFRPQTHFLTSGAAPDLDFVGRYETFEQDFDRARELVNPVATLEHLNRSPARQDYRSAYTPQMIVVVERQRRADLHLFGYGFDGPTSDREETKRSAFQPSQTNLSRSS